MAEVDIHAILQEFDPIQKAIAQPAGTDAIEKSFPAADTSTQTDVVAIAYFCYAANHMLMADRGFPDVEKYKWITDPKFYRNSFEAWCQSSIVNFLIGLWEYRGLRFDKQVIARNVHTGGYHIETYETGNAYFICISYQFLNLINRYSLLNHYVIETGDRRQQISFVTPTNEVTRIMHCGLAGVA